MIESRINKAPVTLEQHDAKATADLMPPIYWTATDADGVRGFGDTPEEAIGHLEHITAWKRRIAA